LWCLSFSSRAFSDDASEKNGALEQRRRPTAEPNARAAMSLPSTASAAIRDVLSVHFDVVLDDLASLPLPPHRRHPGGGPGGARFVGGGKHAVRVVTLNHNDTVGDALAKLSRHRILSAPVMIQPDVLDADCMNHRRAYGADPDARVEPATLLGFFDVADASRALARQLPADDAADGAKPRPPCRNVLSWMKTLETIEKRVTTQTLIQVLGDDAELMYQASARYGTLFEAIRDGFLGKYSPSHGVTHRIAIFDESGEIVRVVSMSDVVRYLTSKVDALGGIGKTSIKTLGLCKEKPLGLVTVKPTTPAIEAFAEMCEEPVSGVGVVDDDDELIANLSASDLRCIQPEHFGMLGLPTAEFLALLHGTSYSGFSHAVSASKDNPFFAKMSEGGFRRSGPLLIVARPTDAFEEVLNKIVEHGVHRVYVCEPESMRPRGVVTLTDILAFVADAAEGAAGEGREGAPLFTEDEKPKEAYTKAE